MPKRIVFSNSTPNDQGGIIPNEAIDFSRFLLNPVILKQHNWSGEPLGLMSDIKIEDGKYTGLPKFHGITQDSKEYKEMYDGGWLRACSIGGEAIWKSNAAGQNILDKDGLRQCEKFFLYEISMVTLPSNPDAVQEGDVFAAKIYNDDEKENVYSNIITLSSQFNKKNQMAKEKTAEELAAEQAANPAPAEDKDVSKHVILASELPGIIKSVISDFALSVKNMFAAPSDLPKHMESEPDGDEPVKTTKPKGVHIEPDNKPIGLKAKKAEEAEKAKQEAEKAAEKAAKAVEETEKAKKEAEEKETEEAKERFEACKEAAEKACHEAEEAEEKYNSAKKEADETEDDEPDEEKAKEKAAKEKAEKEKTEKEKTKNTATMPALKTPAQIREQLNLAAAPDHKLKVQIKAGESFSKLSAKDNKEGERIIQRVITRDGGQKSLADYAIVCNSIIEDSKFAAVVDKLRIMQNVNEAALGSYQSNPSMRAGLKLKDLAAQLNAGSVEMMGRDNVMRNITNLSSSDDALATPATLAIEWLSLALFKLFPTTSWKNDIPIFGAQDTGNNLGIIWTNIMADPTITKGTQPTNPANYTYTDTAVALKLVPYWLQPMLWAPLTMHMLRYDQMSTGWAQAFAKWAAVMDDDLLYTLASTVPAASTVLTSGQGFNIANSSSPDAFYWNPSFAGNLAKPLLNDIITVEQIYNRQNFNLDEQKPVLVIDPTMDSYISKDPETKSLLTRWINADGADLLKFKHTILNQRSRVAVYDPATSAVKDPEGVIPSTAVSSAVGFIPSQVGIGLGMLDVFMIQDPSNYGYKMSADIRIGIKPLRADFAGTSLLTYGTPPVV